MSAFVYGSLLAPEVLHALLGRVPKQSKASLSGYKRYSIKQRPYPGIIRDSDSVVLGEVLHDLTREDQDILDEFEDIRSGYYAKTAASVVLQESQETFNTEVYVYCSQSDLYGDWSYESFREEHLEDYVEMCKQFKQVYLEDLGLLSEMPNRPRPENP
mmetsp:Transcript_28040/g.61366  ORF Transcript_28040/g.61366 Transcript_28040/m.61366 type:complete len:158 (+) Transcript_28040:77-550(+)